MSDSEHPETRYFQLNMWGGHLVGLMVVVLGLMVAAFFFGFRAGGGAFTDQLTPESGVVDHVQRSASETVAEIGADRTEAAEGQRGGVKPPATSPTSDGSSADEGVTNRRNPPAPAAPVPDRTATPTESPGPDPPEAGSSSGKFSVQVAALSSSKEAENLAERLRKRGYGTVAVSRDDGSGRPLWKVWVGSYESRDDARTMLSRLQGAEREITNAFIVRR